MDELDTITSLCWNDNNHKSTLWWFGTFATSTLRMIATIAVKLKIRPSFSKQANLCFRWTRSLNSFSVSDIPAIVVIMWNACLDIPVCFSESLCNTSFLGCRLPSYWLYLTAVIFCLCNLSCFFCRDACGWFIYWAGVTCLLFLFCLFVCLAVYICIS